MRFQRKVSGVEQMDLSFREIPLIGGSTGWQKCRIVASPDGQQRWSVFSEVGLEGRVERDVAAVVENQIELDFLRSRSRHVGDVEDAKIGSRELEITLTARQKGSSAPIPMCGVPHHAAAGYIARLVKKGYRVAICEQTEVATAEKKLVKREVVRVITPGTAIDPQLLESKESIYLAAI
jgi:hypothetical protein